jgi:hypothetical protein
MGTLDLYGLSWFLQGTMSAKRHQFISCDQTRVSCDHTRWAFSCDHTPISCDHFQQNWPKVLRGGIRNEKFTKMTTFGEIEQIWSNVLSNVSG